MQPAAVRNALPPVKSYVPEVRINVTPNMLMYLNACGILYAVIVTLMIFVTIVFWTLPVVHPDPDEFWPRTYIVCFFLGHVVVNYTLVAMKRSYYSETLMGGRLVDPTWRKCLDCNHSVPPRAHHCTLCQRCILRRDHHCFFTGSCVGFENQRYFLVFCFYCAVGCSYCFYLMQQYILLTYLQTESISFIHYILPVAAIECIFQTMSVGLFYSIFICYLCVITTLGTLCIFVWQIILVSYGATTHEYSKGNWSHNKGVSRNMREVFGSCWVLNFVVPMLWVKNPGNGVDWNYTKVL